MSDSVTLESEAHWVLAERCWDAAARESGRGDRIEVYLRAARRVRVRLTRDGSAKVEHGRDEGLAVRVHRPAKWETGFAAAAGVDPGIAAWAARSAASLPTPSGAAPWETSPGVRRDLRRAAPEPEDPLRLEAWIREAIARSGISPAGDPWVEVSDTIEAGRHETGGWIRSRRRVWAVDVAPAVRVEGVEPIPRVVAAPDLVSLPEDPWSASGPDEGDIGSINVAPSEYCVIFDDDALAALVPALVASFSGTADRSRIPVGPGWVVADDPLHRGSLAGGTWDDAGFPSSATTLADGRRLVGDLLGPGCLLRGSFRDPPEPSPSLLVVDPPPATVPRRALRVLAVRVHVLEGGWILEADGLLLRDGDPAGAFHHARIHASPRGLVAACVGGLGPARLRGGLVFSPALCFERLRVEG